MKIKEGSAYPRERRRRPFCMRKIMMNRLNDRFYMNFYGRTEAVEQAFSEWRYAGKPERKENCLRYAVDTSAFTDGGRDDSEDGMEPLEVFYYVLYPGEMPDRSLEMLPRWNSDGGFWDGSDDIWEYCLIGDSRENADALFHTYLPENESMFDEACVIRFADEASFIAYLKCTALGYRGNHRQDHYPAEHMPLHHTPGVPLSYKMINPEEAEALPKGENIGMYAVCTSPEEAERAETFCEKESGLHCFGGLVTSDDQPESFCRFLVPVYDGDIRILRTLYHIQNNYAVEQGFVLEAYPAGIHIAETPEGRGLFDACGGLWIFPPLNEDIYTVSGEDDGYLVSVQGGRKGMIRIMGDSRLRKIVAALLIPCEYDEIFQRGEEIVCIRDGKEYKYDKRRDRIAD